MGLFSALVTLPLAPVRGVAWIGEQVREVAEREHGQRRSAGQRLAEIEAAWRAGEITDARREELEEQVVDDLLAQPPTEGHAGLGYQL
jgi:hypothetical protein